MGTVEILEAGVNGWLAAEEASSSRPRDENNGNAYLNGYDAIMTGLILPQAGAGSIQAQKNESHIERFSPNNAFWSAFERYPENDFAAGRMAFAGLMKLSGTRRMLSYLHAADEDDYLVLRATEAILPVEVLSYRAEALLKSAYGIVPSEHEIEASRMFTITSIRMAADALMSDARRSDAALHEWAQSGKRAEMSAEAAILSTQVDCLDFIVCIAAFGAGLRGGELAKSPTLEPRSISLVPEVIYPFQDGFWATYQPSFEPKL